MWFLSKSLRSTWLLMLLGAWGGGAVVAAGEVVEVKLYPEGAPGARGTEERDTPTITVYRPGSDIATGSAVVICPGGGYGNLALDHEGRQVAEWLNALGITGVVLKYRLGPRYHHPAMLQDAQRAIRTVRARAGEWGLDPERVAILGFSAGGHLASTAGTHFDAGRPDADDPVERQSSRPDLMILAYPVISLQAPYSHGGSRRNLLGDNPPAELEEDLSNETQVTSDTPPTFLVHTNGDTGVPAENSIAFALALRRAKVPVELHLFETGPHGLGLGSGSPTSRITPNAAFGAWPGLCATWLELHGFRAK